MKKAKNQYLLYRSLGVVLMMLVLGGGIFWYYETRRLPHEATEQEPSEIAEIKAKQTVAEQAPIYRHLIERIGALGAQEALLRSGLPFTGETHLLNHTVGEWLYEKQGDAGLIQCRDYFLSSCYHGFVLSAIAREGTAAFPKIMGQCKSAGLAVYPQCAHAIGHGLLTWRGYKNIPEALAGCTDTIKTVPDFPSYNCEDGVFMENIWGIHDGKPSPDRWVDASDPEYPCNDPRIKMQYQPACWGNQPALLYQQFDRDIARVGKVCAGVKDAKNQQSCFDGLARQIHPIAAGRFDETNRFCRMLPSGWINFCLETIAGSALSVGDRVLPFQICSSLMGEAGNNCYGRISSSLPIYVANPDELKTYCAQVPEVWRNTCQTRR